eukprot:s1031_g36.t1
MLKKPFVALQTAASTAQAAIAAIAEIKKCQVAGQASKPKESTGRPEEDRRLWNGWKFSAIQHVMTKNAAYQQSIEHSIVFANAIDMTQLAQEEKGRSQQLCDFLAGTVKERLFALLPLMGQQWVRGGPNDSA